jgi:hypothetical protein
MSKRWLPVFGGLVTTGLGVVINLATELKPNLWAWLGVGVLTIAGIVVGLASERLVRARRADDAIVNSGTIVSVAGGRNRVKVSTTGPGVVIAIGVVVIVAVLSGLLIGRAMTTAPRAAVSAPTGVPPTAFGPAAGPNGSPMSSVPAAVLKGSIDDPADHAVVERMVFARGTINGLAEDHQLYLLLRWGDCYFPECAEVSTVNSWWGAINVGGDEAAGGGFILILADIGPGGIAAFKRYYDAESARGSASGVCSQRELTGAYEATVLASIQIKRRS